MNDTDNITRDILSMLHRHGHAAWRQNAAHVRGRRTPKDSQGIGDIVAVLAPDGRHLEVEVKVNRDTLRDSQVKHSQLVTGAGGIHKVVHSLDEFLSWWQEFSSDN